MPLWIEYIWYETGTSLELEPSLFNRDLWDTDWSELFGWIVKSSSSTENFGWRKLKKREDFFSEWLH